MTMGRKTRKYYRKGGGAERKLIDTTFSATNTAAQGNVYLLNAGIVQGSGSSQRIGQDICIKSINIRIKATRMPDGSAVLKNDTVRIILFYTKSYGVNLAAAGPDAATFLLQLSSAGIGQILSPLNLNNVPNFVVLKDVVQELDDGHGSEFYWQFFHKCNIPVKYLSTASATGGPTDFRNGQLWLFITSINSGTFSANVAGACRLRYTDI